jgi:histidyl-tRNA synthetase
VGFNIQLGWHRGKKPLVPVLYGRSGRLIYFLEVDYMLTQGPKGTQDLLPSEAYKWHYVENLFRTICMEAGYKEIRTPVFEHTELFERGVGDTTDIVQKEMYTFKDKGNRSITLKAEGTAPAVRAFVEHGIYNDAMPIKMYYITPVLRYEKPQAGRLRQHHQFGVEAFGSPGPTTDAEVINLAMELYNRLGIKNLDLNINSIGCPECRENYNKLLMEYLGSKLSQLCPTCNDRYHKNPMRIIDCKEEKCRQLTADVPLMLDHICPDCSEHFDKLKQLLTAMDIPFKVNPKIVRGLDYYNKTAFEVIYGGIGAQDTVCGGGRYDGLVQTCGGPSIPAVGFGMGIERLLLTLESQGIEIPKPQEPTLYIAPMGQNALIKALAITAKLRSKGVSADCDHMGRSLKAQMKYANKTGFRYTVVLGDDEITRGEAKIKNMAEGSEEVVPLENLEIYFTK